MWLLALLGGLHINAAEIAVAPAPAPNGSLRLTTAVIRILGSTAKLAKQPLLAGYSNVADFIKIKEKEKLGEINVLFLTEKTCIWDGRAKFELGSMERRPAFSLDKTVNATLTNRTFGVNLEVAVESGPDGYLLLNYRGNIAWSPGLIGSSKAEKFLLFGMSVMSKVAPGSVYEESEDDDDLGSSGINLKSVFQKKPKKGKVQVATEASFLVDERYEIPLKGGVALRDGKCLAVLGGHGQADKEAELFFILFTCTRTE